MPLWASTDLGWAGRTGAGKLELISRRADVREAAVLSSTGMGLPSAVDAASDVDDVFGWKSGKANEERCFALLLLLLAAVAGREAADARVCPLAGGPGVVLVVVLGVVVRVVVVVGATLGIERDADEDGACIRWTTAAFDAAGWFAAIIISSPCSMSGRRGSIYVGLVYITTWRT